MGALPYKAVINVLTGLTNCSVLDFVKFDFLLQQAKVKVLDTDSHEENTLEQVKAILGKAVDAYHSLCPVDKWHFSNKSSVHFNAV